MPKSSDIQKKRGEMPAGYHYHPGYGYSHPLNQPHRPGSKADQWHKEHNVPNAWFDEHGITREDYEKGEDSEGNPEEKPKDKPKEDYSKVQFSGIMQWDCEKELKSEFSEHYERIDKLQSRFDKVRQGGYDNANTFRRVFDSYFKEQGMEIRLSSKLLNELPKDVVDDFIQSIITSMKECPFGASAVRNIECFRDPKFDKEVMHFQSSKRDDGFGFGINVRYLNGRSNNTKPQKTITTYNPETEEFESKEILDADGNPTEWGFHFDDNSTFAQSITHEYGHALDYAIASMIMQVSENFDPVDLNSSFNEFKKELGTGIGYTSIDEPYYNIPKRTDFAEEHNLTSENSRRLFLSFNEYNDNKDAIDKWFEDQGMTVIGFNDKEIEENDRASYLYVKMDRKSLTLSEKQLKELKEKGPASAGVLRNGIGSVVSDNAINRVRECEKMYKKLYNIDVIDPTEVYSGYGFSGLDMIMPQTDMKSKGEFTRARACKERMAEAYQDVIIRKDRSNSMSRLLYAHTQYEILQLTKGYEGSFEDFINDKIGRERFAERITKSTLHNMNQRFINHIRKSIESDRMDTIRKHQAFIMSVSKQFDKKLCKSAWDEPKNTIYVWDKESGINILTITPDNPDDPHEWAISNSNSNRFWDYNKWESSWTSLDDAIASVRRHKRNVTICIGYYGDDSTDLEEV